MSANTQPSKAEIVKKHRRNEKDTGSPEVQIALITNRIETLSKHFAKHVQDQHSKRGLHALVSQRKNLISYLKKEDINRYRHTLAELGLRK